MTSNEHPSFLSGAYLVYWGIMVNFAETNRNQS